MIIIIILWIIHIYLYHHYEYDKKIKNQNCQKNVGKLINNNFMFASLACKNTDLMSFWYLISFRFFEFFQFVAKKLFEPKLVGHKTYDMRTI